jgi:hypothetical protein
MSVVWNGPYKKDNPRSVNGAERKGWHIVEVPRNYFEKHKLSWVGIELWTGRNTRGYFATEFLTRRFAFEREEDASKFIFQFVI